MCRPRKTVYHGDIEAFLSDERVNWLKCPSYGMSDELNRLYNKTKTKWSLLNVETEQDIQDVLNLIKLIISDTDITFINKLYLIDELIEANKNYYDAYDTIIDTAIAFHKGQ
jgi:hypothetical protein